MRIARSLLNGENVTYLVTSQIVRPESIAIDFLTDDVYWSDTVRDMIEVISWDGKNRRTLARNVPKAIGLIVTNNDVYVMDRAFSAVRPSPGRNGIRHLLLRTDHAREQDSRQYDTTFGSTPLVENARSGRNGVVRRAARLRIALSNILRTAALLRGPVLCNAGHQCAAMCVRVRNAECRSTDLHT